MNRFRTISGQIPDRFQTVSGDGSGMKNRTLGQPLPEPKIWPFSELILLRAYHITPNFVQKLHRQTQRILTYIVCELQLRTDAEVTSRLRFRKGRQMYAAQ